jgi:hypothetical protein
MIPRVSNGIERDKKPTVISTENNPQKDNQNGQHSTAKKEHFPVVERAFGPPLAAGGWDWS